MNHQPPGALLRAAFGTDADAVEQYAAWAATFDPEGELDPAAFVLLPSVDRRVSRLGPARLGPVPPAVAARVRGIARRAWTANQMRLHTVHRVLDALTRARVRVRLAPGAITSLADLGHGSVEIALVDLVVPAERASTAVAALLAIGAHAEQDPEPVFNGWTDDGGAFLASLDGVRVRIRWEPRFGHERSVDTDGDIGASDR